MPLNASPSSTASLLQIAPGADVLTLNRIVETADGDPVEWRVTFRPEYARVRARGIPSGMKALNEGRGLITVTGGALGASARELYPPALDAQARVWWSLEKLGQ